MNILKVFKFLQKNPRYHYCDDCISIRVNVNPRQQVNQICRLKIYQDIDRYKDKCSSCGAIKLVNRIK